MLSRIYFIDPRPQTVHHEHCVEYQQRGHNWPRLGQTGNPLMAINVARQVGYVDANICPSCDRV